MTLLRILCGMDGVKLGWHTLTCLLEVAWPSALCAGMQCRAVSSIAVLALLQDIGLGPSLLVAFLAGCGNVLITNPIWTVATRMQVCALLWRSLCLPWHACKHALCNTLPRLPCCMRGYPTSAGPWRSCAAWGSVLHLQRCSMTQECPVE